MTDGPQYDFSGQTAIVTGGARGIGRAVAEHFLRSGAQVWIWDIDPVELNGAHSLSVDVANARQITEALASTVRQSPRIDILVNNAGYLGAYRPFHELDAGEWQKIVEVNLMGVFGVTRTVLPLIAACGTWADCQYGIPRRQGRSAEPRNIFSGKRWSDCVHKSPFPRGVRHRYSRKLRCPRSYQHGPHYGIGRGQWWLR